MDFLWALLFLLWYEALSLPLRGVLASWPAPPDVRRMLSRVAGPALLVLPVWFAAHLLGFALGRGFGLAWLALALAIGLAIGLRQARPGRVLGYEVGHEQAGRGGLGRQVALDAAAVALFFGFVALRRWVPEMTMEVGASAAEKFSNAMIFWTSWHAPHLPPQDYWLAGQPLTYYYWGHFHWAWIARMGGFPAELALNLGFCTAVLLVWEAAYLLARAAKLAPWWAVGAALCVTWGGNPSALAGAWQLIQAPGPIHWTSYDFWGPSRAIANVVDEFPAFSAILGDFHSHHLALPWLTGWLALTLAGLHWPGVTDLPRWRHGARSPFHGRAVAWGLVWLTLAIAAVMTNLWNLPLVGFATAVMLVLTLRRGWATFLPALGLSLALGLILLGGMRLLRAGAPLPLPSGTATSFMARLPVRILPAHLRSTLGELFALWGLPVLALAAGALIHGVRRPRGGREWWRLGLALAGLALILAAVQPQPPTPAGPARIVGLTHGGVRPHGAPAEGLYWSLPGGTSWAWVGMAFWVGALMLGRRPWLPWRTGWMLVAACITLGGIELVYLKDRFEGDLVRYNSYFKFSYPVWPVLWIGAWDVARRLWQARLAGPLRWTLRLGLTAIFLATFVYPLFAFPARLLMARYGDSPERRPTLDAFDFTRHRPAYAAEAPMLAWIRQNVPQEDAVAEAAWVDPVYGHSYNYGGRVASLAGRPVPLGWAHHEQQWRGPAGYAMIEERERAINRLYLAPTPEAMRAAAQRLGVRWVLYGQLERRQYGERALAVLRAAAPLAAESPEFDPKIFLFDFRTLKPTMDHP